MNNRVGVDNFTGTVTVNSVRVGRIGRDDADRNWVFRTDDGTVTLTNYIHRDLCRAIIRHYNSK